MSLRTIAVLTTFLLAATSPFDAGVKAYRSGDMKAAAESFKAAGEDPVASYDAGLAELASGDLDAAIASFEAAAVRGKGEVRASARLNLGLCHVKKGDAVRSEKPKDESREDEMKRLGAAAQSYRSALALFRRVPPPSPDAGEGAKAAKVRLLATLDELQKLEKEEKKAAEEKQLSDPPALLLKMLTAERDRRRAVEGLKSVARRHRRLPARRIRDEEYEARELLTKLAARLTSPPPAPAAPSGKGPSSAPKPPPVSPAAKAAAAAVTRATKAMGEAEARLDAVDRVAAVKAQTDAIAELTGASLRLPAPLSAVVGKLLSDQGSLLDLTKSDDPSLVPAEEGETLPFLGLLEQVPDPSPVLRPGAGQPPPAPGGAPPLGAKAAAKIRSLAGEAKSAAKSAADLLAAGKTADSIPDEKTVLAKLQEISDLLPKPPEPPIERLRRLLATQQAAKKSLGGLTGMAADARKAGEDTLARSQTGHGREAGDIAETLSRSPGGREKEAVGKVRDAEREIHGSSEAIRRDRIDPAGEAVDRAIQAIRDAIAILSGKKPGDQRQNPKDQPQKKKPGSDEQKKKEKQDTRELSPREARRMMEEMDRARREQEQKLMPGAGGARVDKDW